jgi:hypothetical protein
MSCILHFFGKKVCHVDFSIHVTYCNKVVLNVLPDYIFFHLNVTETLGRTRFRPVNTSLIVIVDDRSSIIEGNLVTIWIKTLFLYPLALGC